MKFFISNTRPLENRFGKWYYTTDQKCSRLAHNKKLYIYHGYVIDQNYSIEDHILKGTIGTGMNGNYFVIELTEKSLKISVDYFSQHKIFYRHCDELFEVSNRIYLFSFDPSNIDKKQLLDRNREKPDRLTREIRTNTLFANTKVLPAFHSLEMNQKLYIERSHDPTSQIHENLFGNNRGSVSDRDQIEDFIHECMDHHSSILKSKYKNIISSISEGVDSILQDCFFPKEKKITYDFVPSTVDLSYKNTFIDSIRTAKVERHEFVVDEASNIASELADDPETTHMDCLPTFWQIKKFYPKADLLMYGQLGDQIFMHDPFLLYMMLLGEVADNENMTIDEKYNSYRESVARYSSSYSSRESIDSREYHYLDERFQASDRSKFADNLKYITERWQNEIARKVSPLSSTYSRDLIHSCDIAVSSLYADNRFFGIIHKSDKQTIMDNINNLSTQRNILKKKFNLDFVTPYKDPAIFRMRDSILAWKKKSVSFCLQEHIVNGKIVDM